MGRMSSTTLLMGFSAQVYLNGPLCTNSAPTMGVTLQSSDRMQAWCLTSLNDSGRRKTLLVTCGPFPETVTPKGQTSFHQGHTAPVTGTLQEKDSASVHSTIRRRKVARKRGKKQVLSSTLPRYIEKNTYLFSIKLEFSVASYYHAKEERRSSYNIFLRCMHSNYTYL